MNCVLTAPTIRYRLPLNSLLHDSLQAALQRHIELVHSEGAPPPSTCNLCGFAAASSGALKAHMTCIHRFALLRYQC